jgi:hypothetical protein
VRQRCRQTHQLQPASHGPHVREAQSCRALSTSRSDAGWAGDSRESESPPRPIRRSARRRCAQNNATEGRRGVTTGNKDRHFFASPTGAYRRLLRGSALELRIGHSVRVRDSKAPRSRRSRSRSTYPAVGGYWPPVAAALDLHPR